MTKEEFKSRWEQENGGGITFEDIAECAVKWGISKSPMTRNMFKLGNKVLVAAGLEPYWETE